MTQNTQILKVYYNDDVNKQLNKVLSRTYTTLNKDEIESIKLETIWKCLSKFDDNSGTLFTTYLLSAFRNNLQRESNEYIPKPQIKQDIPIKSYSEFEFYDSLSVLPEKYQRVVIDRFVYDMNYREIGKKNGYSGEQARRNMKKAIKMAKHRIFGV